MIAVGHDPLARSRSAARQWLRYQSPETSQDVRVKVAKYGERIGGISEGAPIEALRNSQMFWAACQLGDMMREAAFKRREERMDGKVVQFLSVNHTDSWRTFANLYPYKPLNALMVEIADKLAEVIGTDIF